MSTSCHIVPRANVGPYLYDYEDSFIFLYPNLNVGLEKNESRMFGKQDYDPYLSNVFSVITDHGLWIYIAAQP